MSINSMSPPAAFGRLCVETSNRYLSSEKRIQPPSGGCVLKLWINNSASLGGSPAAFGRLCVETAYFRYCRYPLSGQPPSGGCVLKLITQMPGRIDKQPAAFGRLCVETSHSDI